MTVDRDRLNVGESFCFGITSRVGKWEGVRLRKDGKMAEDCLSVEQRRHPLGNEEFVGLGLERGCRERVNVGGQGSTGSHRRDVGNGRGGTTNSEVLDGDRDGWRGVGE